MRLLKELQEHIDAGRGDKTFYLGGRERLRCVSDFRVAQ